MIESESIEMLSLGRRRCRGRRQSIPFLTLAVWMFAACSPDVPASEPAQEIVVFAAASLIDVLEALAESFEAQYPDQDVVIHAAGSSLLARQLAQGAPADVFFSANVAWMTYLVDEGKMRPDFREPIGNELVLVRREGTIPSEFWNERNDEARIALADPAHVPAGIYAKEALTCMGVWDSIQDCVIPTLDVRAALQALAQGGVAASIVYRSDVLVADGSLAYEALPDSCQPAISYAVGIHTAAGNSPAAEHWVAYLVAPEQAALWERFGFSYRYADAPS